MLTRQEIFEKSISGLVKQGSQAVELYESSCKLRTKDGKKCAVGMLLADEDYDEHLEGLSVIFKEPEGNSIEVANVLKKSGVDLSDNAICILLHRLQILHDDYTPAVNDTFAERMKANALRVAEEQGLSSDFIKGL